MHIAQSLTVSPTDLDVYSITASPDAPKRIQATRKVKISPNVLSSDNVRLDRTLTSQVADKYLEIPQEWRIQQSDGSLLDNIGGRHTARAHLDDEASQQLPKSVQEVSAAPEIAHVVFARAYQGGEIPGRLPANHPLAGFVVRGPPLEPGKDNLAFGDTSNRFRNLSGDIFATWQEIVPNTFTINQETAILAFVQQQGDKPILFPRGEVVGIPCAEHAG